MVEIIDQLFSVSNSLFSGFVLKFILAITIILIGFVIGRLAGKLVTTVLHEFELDKIVKKATSTKFSAEGFIGNLASYAIYFFVFIMALNQLGLATPILYILAISVLLIVVISITLAVRDLIPNMFAGFTIHRKGFLDVGDTIKVKDMKGKIISINLVETRIETKSKDLISIPNVILTKNEVVKVKKP